jgi:hypothetical protein
MSGFSRAGAIPFNLRASWSDPAMTYVIFYLNRPANKPRDDPTTMSTAEALLAIIVEPERP